jgi:hypothetical protein
MPIASNFVEDVKYALRSLRLNPGFACVAVLSLALGIGANTAIFSLVDAVMLRLLPVKDPQRLVLLSDPASSGVSIGTETGVRSLFTYQEFEHIRDHNQAFSGMFASESNPGRVNVRLGQGPVEEVRGKLVSGDYFAVLGVRPASGRVFTAAEDSTPGVDPVAVLGYEYWLGRFGSDPAVIGGTIQLNRSEFTVIGIAPRGFRGEIVGDSPDLYLPMMMEPQVKPGRFWLRENLKGMPGVRSVTISENGLFGGTESGDQITVEGYHSDKEEDNAARFDQVGPDYFSTVGIPILLGREIGQQDTASSNPVCVVNEAFAKFYFGSSNPIGKHVRDEFPDTRVTFEIVGVARDAKDHRLRGEIPRRFYVPFFHPLGEIPSAAYFEIRSLSDPESLLPAMRRRIQESEPALPILGSRTLTELVNRSITRERMIAQVSSFFGVLALLLSSMGLYGVLAYAIERRTHEIGIRMALGAQQRWILGSILRETVIMAAIGVLIGVPAALACGRLIESSLFGLAVLDPITLILSILVIAAVAGIAGYVPARRAARVDPLIALRCE